MKFAFFISFLIPFFSLAAFGRPGLKQKVLADHLLTDALHFYNSDLRNRESGQYYDAVGLGENADAETNSSTAATGMGLMSLAVADATGDIPDARALTVQTLSAVLNPDFSKRHPAGWFRHWFNAADGSDNSWSKADGYSTIDTAILAAGAVFSANYFSAQEKDVLGVVRALSDRLLFSVDWASAIADSENGRLFLNYDLASNAPRTGTVGKFNEYVLVACVGKLAEDRKGVSGPMTKFWNQHFASTAALPKKIYGTTEVLTDFPMHFLSSFTIQFAYYLCSGVNSNPDYVRYFKNAQLADQQWFRDQGVKSPHRWGNGAGQAIKGYAANAINDNPDLIVSPHIIAGFLAENPQNLASLQALYNERDCIYSKNGRELLWRCSQVHPEARLDRLQAIDFSTMILGLATVKPGLGKKFFKTYSAAF